MTVMKCLDKWLFLPGHLAGHAFSSCHHPVVIWLIDVNFDTTALARLYHVHLALKYCTCTSTSNTRTLDYYSQSRPTADVFFSSDSSSILLYCDRDFPPSTSQLTRWTLIADCDYFRWIGSILLLLLAPFTSWPSPTCTKTSTTTTTELVFFSYWSPCICIHYIVLLICPWSLTVNVHVMCRSLSLLLIETE